MSAPYSVGDEVRVQGTTWRVQEVYVGRDGNPTVALVDAENPNHRTAFQVSVLQRIAELRPDEPRVYRTVKEVRDALAELPAVMDDLPFAVNVPDGDDAYSTFAVTLGPHYQRVDWGDGGGMVDDKRYIMIEAFAILHPYTSGLEINYCDPAEDETL